MPGDSLLPRVLEPEVMDSAEEARDYDQMDHRAVNESFAVDFLLVASQSRLAAEMEVLDLGTGTAQIPIELCRRHPRLHIVAVDLSAEMLRLAEQNVASAGFEARISLQQVDAKRLPFDDGRFAAVISNSIVHHVARPEAVLSEALRVLMPRGAIFVRDLKRPFDGGQVAALVRRYTATANDHQRALFEASLRAALTVEEMRALVGALGWKPQSVVPSSDRHWTWMGQKP